MIATKRRLFPSAQITRRNLLQTTALVGAGLLALPLLVRRAYAQLPGAPWTRPASTSMRNRW